MTTNEPLLQLPAFSGLSRVEAGVLLRNTDLVQLPDGQSLLLAAGAAQELVVVVRGSLRALSRSGWTARPGDVLGAHALLSRSTQPYGFRCCGPALVACAGVEQVRTLLSRSPAFATAVAVALSQELSRTTGTLLDR